MQGIKWLRPTKQKEFPHTENPQDVSNEQHPIFYHSKEHFIYSVSSRLQDYPFQVI